LLIVKHLPYVQRQDDKLNDDIKDPSVLDPQKFQGHHDPDNPESYDTKGKELGLPPEYSLPVPTSSGQKILTICAPNDDNLRAHMSGGESLINNDIRKDRSTIDKSKLAGTPNTTGTSICGIDLELPHPPDGRSTMDKPIDRIDTVVPLMIPNHHLLQSHHLL
jgi:hypothetical protein